MLLLEALLHLLDQILLLLKLLGLLLDHRGLLLHVAFQAGQVLLKLFNLGGQV